MFIFPVRGRLTILDAGLGHRDGSRKHTRACMLGGLEACPLPGFFGNFIPSEVDSETISVSSQQFLFLRFLFCPCL